MERLNDIINRATQRRQPEGNAPVGTRFSASNDRTNDRAYSERARLDGSRPGAAPHQRPLPEQNAHLGQYSRGSGTVNRGIMPPPRQSQSSPPAARGTSVARDQAAYTQSNRHVEERIALPPERGPWSQTNRAPTRHVESYQPQPQADVQAEWSGEWEEDTAPIRYGDWEHDSYEETAPPRDAGESYVLDRAGARIAQTYGRNQRPMVTRELRSQLDEEVEPVMTPHTRLPIPLSSSPATHQAGQGHRLTQPLNRPAAMARIEQASPKVPVRPQIQRNQAAPLIPAPYATSAAFCPICKGAGYLRADVPYGHPNFGKPIACECKEAERVAKRRRQLQEMSNLGELQDKGFDNFNPNSSRSIYNAYHASLEYAEDPYGWLVFIGKVGCGKTHLAAAIANRLLARGSLVLFSTVSDLLDHLRATFMPSSTEVYDQLFQKMREAALLVLDDLGAQQSSPWANEKLFQLLNYRYNSRIPTIITTNNTGLQGVEERIRSRMMDTSLVTRITFEDAVDYRLRNPRRE